MRETAHSSTLSRARPEPSRLPGAAALAQRYFRKRRLRRGAGISHEKPHTEACPSASLQRSCLMMLTERGEMRPQREEKRRGWQRLSISRAFREGAGTHSCDKSADRAFPAAGVSLRRQI